MSNKTQSGWQRFRSRFLPATKLDLEQMESRLLTAILQAQESGQLAKLTSDLRGATDPLAQSVANQQPKT